SWSWGCLNLFENRCHGGSHSTCLLIDYMSKFGYLKEELELQNSKNLGRSGLRYWKVSSWCNSVNHDEGKHEGDLFIDHMPHETIHQTIVEIWRFHYGDLLFLRWEKFIDEFGNKILPSENRMRGFFF
nr:hypothetical protein [Tanacetum cinerariifolium]